MKVLIDLDRALADGKITPDEYARLKVLGAAQTSDLTLNILIGSGVIAVAAGVFALFPSLEMGVGIGAMLALIGLALVLRGPERARLLGEILLVIGVVLFAGGVALLDEGSGRSLALATVTFAATAFVARNSLLAGIAVLALSAALGARTAYAHATYMVGISEPTVTVVVFAALAVVLVNAASRLPLTLAQPTLMAARTSVFLVNLGFWIGSLWGDRVGSITVSRGVFSAAWAIALVGAAVWAWRTNRRWPLITATVFGGIHFYTQWFERLGANPIAVLAAGLIAIAIGFVLKTVLASMRAHPAA